MKAASALDTFFMIQYLPIYSLHPFIGLILGSCVVTNVGPANPRLQLNCGFCLLTVRLLNY
jgi:hypothetical protein